MTYLPELHRYEHMRERLKRVAKAVRRSSPFSLEKRPSRAELLVAAGRPNWRLFWLVFLDRLPRRKAKPEHTGSEPGTISSHPSQPVGVLEDLAQNRR
jgi:hypothetical protein